MTKDNHSNLTEFEFFYYQTTHITKNFVRSFFVPFMLGNGFTIVDFEAKSYLRSERENQRIKLIDLGKTIVSYSERSFHRAHRTTPDCHELHEWLHRFVWKEREKGRHFFFDDPSWINAHDRTRFISIFHHFSCRPFLLFHRIWCRRRSNVAMRCMWCFDSTPRRV